MEKGGGIPWRVVYLARYRSPFRLCRRPYIPRPYPNSGLGLGYPGFGNSDAPPATEFRYTFDHLAQIIDGLTLKLGLRSYVLYNNDYGGPIGMRLAVAHPERVKSAPPPIQWTPVVGSASQEVFDGKTSTTSVYERLQATSG